MVRPGVSRRVKLADYRDVISAELEEEIRTIARRLAGLRIQHINTTAEGGGVAEILKRLVPLMEDVGLGVRWDVFRGSEDFFRITKAFHNAFHGVPVAVTPAMRQTYLQAAAENQELLWPHADVIVLHDQQPLGLIHYRRRTRAKMVWYCHIDPVHVVPEVWDFLAPLAAACDAAVYHLTEYVKLPRQLHFVMPPAIDPLSPKNYDLPPERVREIVAHLGLPEDRPLVVQVSRFDRLKDPVGLTRVFRQLRQEAEACLVLAGGGASDDPEGQEVLAEVRQAAAGMTDVFVLELPPASDEEINALQRAAAVVVQNSVREGFGLTVTEALWKGKAVVARPVGGIKLQVIDGITGLTASNEEEMAAAILHLLRDPRLAQRLGAAGREYVQREFILPVYLKRWLLMLERVLNE